MPISPQDYSLWSRMTGNRYPRTAKEKAAVGPAVKKFIQNMDKQGAQGGKSEEKSGKINISGRQLATGALGAGLVAGAVAVARRKGSRDAINEFLRNLGDKPDVKTYTRPSSTPPASSTPAPTQQQEYGGNIGPGVDAMERKIESMGRSIESTSQKIEAFKKDLNLNRPASEVQTKSPVLIANKTPVSTKNVGQDPAKYLAALKSIDPSKLGNSEQQRLEFAIDDVSAKVNQNVNQNQNQNTTPRSLADIEKRGKALKDFQQTLIADGNVTGAKRVGDEINNLRQQYASQLRQQQTTPTTTGKNLSPEEKEKAKRLAEFEQFKINERSASKSNIAAIRQAQIESGNLRGTEFNIKNNDEPTGGAVVRKPAPKPPNLPSAASQEDIDAAESYLEGNDIADFPVSENMSIEKADSIMRGIREKRKQGTFLKQVNQNSSTSQRVDNFVQLTLDDIPTGVRTGQPKKVATDVTNTALGQNADNLISKPNEIIGNPTLKSKHDTEMKATQIIRDQRDIANFRNERNKIYDRTLNQLTNGDPSKADARTERRAARLADKVINKSPGYQADRNRYHQAIKNTVSRDTRINAEDAQFQADLIFDEDTGKAATTSKEDGQTEIRRSMKNMRSVKNIETGQKTAIGRAIRGRARNLDQGELPQEQTRDAGASREEINQKTGRPQIISVSDESADVPGGLIGSPLASTVGLPVKGGGLTESVDVPVIVRTQKVNPNTGKSQIISNVVIKQATGALPLGEGKQARAPRGQVRKVVETPGDESKTDFTIEGAIRDESGKLVGGKKVPRAGSTLSGYSPYGKEVGKFISGAMDREGNYTSEAKGSVFVGPGQGLYDAGDTFKDDKGKTRFLRNQPGAQQPRKPSEPIFENTGLTSREERNMGNIPSEVLRSRITTDRSGQLRKTARDARIELLSRGATIPAIPPSREERESRLTFFLPGGTGEAKSTVPQKPAPATRLEPGQRGPASSLQDRPPIGGSDPAVKRKIGADFTRIVDKGIQDINRTVAPDKRQAAIQDLIGKTKEKIKTREAGGLIIDDIQNLNIL